MPVARFQLCAIDCPDPRTLARFYSALTQSWYLRALAQLELHFLCTIFPHINVGFVQYNLREFLLPS